MRFLDRTSTLALLILLAAAGARADYVCQQLDVPGSTFTQVWQLNNAGTLAAGSDLGGFTYSGGAWTPLPAPPARSGYTAFDLAALGVNDSGVITGPAFDPITASEQGFILTGDYTFFSSPYAFPGTEPRAIGNNGDVTGMAWDPSIGVGVAFVYNPGAPNEYPSGFTQVVPTLNGAPSFFVIPGGMNSAGQFVGSALFAGAGRWAFLYDPARASPITLFRIESRSTQARGINDNGYMTGFHIDSTGQTVGFVLTNAGFQLFNCSGLDASGGVFGESINNDGIVTGNLGDSSGNTHGFIAYPNVALPVASSGGSFVFDVAVSPNTPVFLDPAPAVGYKYSIGAGNPRFASVSFPIGIGDSVYTLIVDRHAFTLAGGEKLDFTRNGFLDGVDAFEVLGIENSANLDPGNPTAFVTQVTFAPGGNGRFTGTMTPMTAAGELADLRDNAMDVGPGKSLASKARSAESAYAAGDVAGACGLLRDFVSEIKAQTGKKLSPSLAGALIAEADAIGAALPCK